MVESFIRLVKRREQSKSFLSRPHSISISGPNLLEQVDADISDPFLRAPILEKNSRNKLVVATKTFEVLLPYIPRINKQNEPVIIRSVNVYIPIPCFNPIEYWLKFGPLGTGLGNSPFIIASLVAKRTGELSRKQNYYFIEFSKLQELGFSFDII